MIPASKIKDIHKKMVQASTIIKELAKDIELIKKVHLPGREEYVGVSAVAVSNGVCNETIKRHCRHGRIPGAKKVHGKWLVPYYTNLESLGL
jgi:hypothetical protein